LIVGKSAHIFQWEAGGSSVLGGVSMSQVPVQPDGTLRLEDIQASLRDATNVHQPLTRLICLENTQGGVGGVPISAEYTQKVADFAHARGLKLHIDGARLFNAAAALNVHPRDLVKGADSIQICLSKGLAAPVGSLVVGSREFIQRAYRMRKLVGGAMRQVGVVAAAGLIALRDMRQRLDEDHVHAQLLAEALALAPGITVHPVHQRTNMVFFSIPETMDSAAFRAAMKAQGIILSGGPHFRLVTHVWITKDRALFAAAAIRHYMEKHAPLTTKGTMLEGQTAY
ncbi:MAG TPA: GntG family PLP-dependent aldolase, partial [Aggregatilineales bacterium]|nr:GntG family PLP-dependent aldolase [Aggregatilineales bacterium]